MKIVKVCKIIMLSAWFCSRLRATLMAVRKGHHHRESLGQSHCNKKVLLISKSGYWLQAKTEVTLGYSNSFDCHKSSPVMREVKNWALLTSVLAQSQKWLFVTSYPLLTAMRLAPRIHVFTANLIFSQMNLFHAALRRSIYGKLHVFLALIYLLTN